MKKPVILFAVQNKWVVSIWTWNVTVGWDGLRIDSPNRDFTNYANNLQGCNCFLKPRFLKEWLQLNFERNKYGNITKTNFRGTPNNQNKCWSHKTTSSMDAWRNTSPEVIWLKIAWEDRFLLIGNTTMKKLFNVTYVLLEQHL